MSDSKDIQGEGLTGKKIGERDEGDIRGQGWLWNAYLGKPVSVMLPAIDTPINCPQDSHDERVPRQIPGAVRENLAWYLHCCKRGRLPVTANMAELVPALLLKKGSILHTARAWGKHKRRILSPYLTRKFCILVSFPCQARSQSFNSLNRFARPISFYWFYDYRWRLG